MSTSDAHYCDRGLCCSWVNRSIDNYHWCRDHQPHAIRRTLWDNVQGVPRWNSYDLKPKGEANSDWTYSLETIEQLLVAHDRGILTTKSLMDVFGVGIAP